MSVRPPLNRLLEADYITRIHQLIFDREECGLGRISPRNQFRNGVTFILAHLDDDEVDKLLDRIDAKFPDEVARYQGNAS